MIRGMKFRIAWFCVLTAVALGVSAPSFAQQSSGNQLGASTFPAPKDPRTRAKAHTELAALYFENGDLIVALEELTLATSIDPEYATAFSTRGIVLYYVKEFESAEKDFKRALSLDGKNPEINNNYGWYLCHTGRANEAIPYFERAYRNPLYQTPGLAYLNAGACHITLRQLDQAEEALRMSLRLMPDNPQALYHLANAAYLRGNYDAAKKHLTQAVANIDPGPEMLWLFLRVERRLGNQSDEASLTAQLRRKFPDSPEYQEFLKGNFE